MRTIEEIQKQIDEHLADLQSKDSYDRWEYMSEGMIAGFRKGIALIQGGKSNAEIAAYAQRDEESYQPHGDDHEDDWQSGYTTALYWAAASYDWNEDGHPLYREGNIFGEPPYQSEGNS